MKKKLSDAQISCLAVLACADVIVGMESFSGLSRKSMEVLQQLGLVKSEGVRKVRWALTKEGKAKVGELVKTGVLTEEVL